MICNFLRWLFECILGLFCGGRTRCVQRPSTPAQEPPRVERKELPQILVLLKDAPGVDFNNDGEVQAHLRSDQSWRDLEVRFGQLKLERAIRTNPAELDKVVGAARENARGYNMRDFNPQFNRYFYLRLPQSSGEPFDLYCALKSAAPVQTVRITQPTENPSSDKFHDTAANHGVGAKVVRINVPGLVAQLANGRVVDIEKAWPGALALPIWPAGSTRVESAAVEDIQHGAQTYGVVAAQPDTSNTEFDGIKGIARGVQFYRCPFLTTGVDPNAAPISLFASAVTDAAASLVKGDVLLIEQAAAGQRPIEVDELVWDAIRAAVAGRELVVIVPVGNAGLDLATVGGAVSVPPGTRTLDCTTPDLATGAILVAAGVSGEQAGTVFGARTPNSNFGDLIDCWAWGDSILSYKCVPDDFDDSIVLTRDYTGYGGTSGAAAIIAGVVAMMQAIRRASNLPVLDARQVRTLLRKYGTPGAPNSSLAHRLMPNLEAMQTELTTNAAILGMNPCDPIP